jgi:catechol 2,3-dioxygenase-like lactoylglutathione lyase family enzyme
MGENLVVFHHIGLAVRDFAAARDFYALQGYHCGEPVIDPIQDVELLFCTKTGSPGVELVRPLHERSPVANYLKQQTECFYHVCFDVSELQAALKQVYGARRYLCVSPRKPAVLFGGRHVSFYYAKGIGLAEFLEPANAA